MDHVRAIVTFASAFIIGALISSCAPVPIAPGQQAFSAPTATPAPLLARVPAQNDTLMPGAQAPAASDSPTPDATAQEEAARAAPALPTATAQPATPTHVPPSSTPRPASPTAEPPTDTPRPQPTNTRPKPVAVVPPTLQDEIFMAGAPVQGIFLGCPRTVDAVPGLIWQNGDGSGTLCLYGFGEGEEVQYEILEATGTLVHSATATSESRTGGEAVVEIPIQTKGHAEGDWWVLARSHSVDLQGSFLVEQVKKVVYASLRLIPADDAIAAGRDLLSMQAGDSLQIVGGDLPAGVPVSAGVYFAPDYQGLSTQMRLHEASAFWSDENGAVSVRLILDPSYQVGYYCVVLAAADDYKPGAASASGATRCFAIK